MATIPMPQQTMEGFAVNYPTDWYCLQWRQPIDVTDIMNEFYAIADRFLADNGSPGRCNTRLSHVDAATVWLNRTYGDWLSANVGPRLQTWQAEAVQHEVEIGGSDLSLRILFKSKDRAAFFKLTHG